MNSRRIMFCFGLGVLGAACSDSRDPDVPTGQSQNAIENGGPGNSATDLGIPVIRTKKFTGLFTQSSAKNFCTGWMYNNEWVVTARHCFIDDKEPKNGHSMRDSGLSMGNQDVEGFDRLVTFVTKYPGTNNFTPDVAMLHLTTGVVVNNDFFFQRSLVKLTDAQLKARSGKDVLCLGYGDTKRKACKDETNTASSELLVGSEIFVYPDAINFNDPNRPFPDYIRLNPKPDSGGPGLTQVTLHGDSGGPCFFDGESDLFATVAVGLPCGANPDFMNDVPVGRLEKLIAKISQSKSSVTGDVNFDHQTDVATLSDDGSGNAVGHFLVSNDLGEDNQDAAFEFDLPLGFPASTADTALAVLNDFDNDGFADLFGTFAGNAMYVLGANVASSVATCVLDPSLCALNNCINDPTSCPIFGSVPTYEDIRTADFDGDGFADAEAFPPACAAPDVFYGGSSGLTTSWAMDGFPTSDGDDGKFLTLAVQPAASIGVPDYTFRIRTKHDPGVTDPELHLDIFDGDMTGSHDTVVTGGQSVTTCYFLLPDPKQDDSGATASTTVHKLDTEFPNNAWGSLLNVTSDGTSTKEMPEALIPGTNSTVGKKYSYLLRIYLTTTTCDHTDYPTDPVANAIKIRVNGELTFESSVDPVNKVGGAISIRGSDAVGPLAALDNCTPDTCNAIETQDVDTEYDGQWNFLIDLTQSGTQPVPNTTEFWLSEADADSTLDPIAPGNATGKSPNINFVVSDEIMGGGNVLLSPPNPSGQFDPSNEPCIAYDVKRPGGGALPPNLYWTWNDVPTHNNIWLALPTTARPDICISPPNGAAQALATTTASGAAGTQLVATFPLHGEKPRFTIPETSASPLAFWVSSEGQKQIGALLPITLGTPEAHGNGHANSAEVRTTGQAVSILKREHADHGGRFDNVVAVLRAELLAAKLNVARGASRGEDIPRGYIYGNTVKVSDTISLADDLLSSTCNGVGCVFDPPGNGNRGNKDRVSVDDLQPVATLLQSINAGQITFRAPIEVSTAALAARAARIAASNAASGFWQSH